jgi:hypothetical protein
MNFRRTLPEIRCLSPARTANASAPVAAPQYDPLGATTALTVRARIYTSSHSDQFRM